ncbi:MAG TPA: isoprenylcysteine carboxylmethyltransferase family protein [Candidatus Binatia bacterium]|nr:isoprenylcysteine carboxylmethyltransferase family protein [Candidatus Binatia bacterium]
MSSFFDYFQLTSLILFLFVLVVRVLYLRFTKHINPIAIGRGKRGFQLVFELYAFVGLAIWMVEVILYSVNSRFRVFPSPLDTQLIDSTAARVTGVILVSFGFVILIWAFISFGVSWRVGFDVKTPGELVTTGMFAVSRNPIYIFLNLWFVGVFLMNGTLIFLIFALLAIVHLHYQILREEKFLAELYGQRYKNYCARTGRYFTFLR